MLDWTSLRWLLFAGFIIYPPLWLSHHRSFKWQLEETAGCLRQQKMVASIRWLEFLMNVHTIHLQYPKIQSDSLENRLNSRNHTTGLFVTNNHHHPLVVVWRVEVWHFLFQLPYEGFDAFLWLSERLHSALFLQIRLFFILKQDQRMLSSITALTVIL